MKRVFVWILVIVSFFSFTGIYLTRHTLGSVDFKTLKVQNVCSGETCSYLVFTKTSKGLEVFTDIDSIWFLKFNSSDVYMKIMEGRSYKALVYGYRLPALGIYRNIIRIEDNDKASKMPPM